MSATDSFGSGFEPPVPPLPAPAAGGFAPEQPTTAGPLPVVRSIGWCFVLLLVSFGLWGFAWVWHTSREVTPRVSAGDEGMSAGVRTGLFWVPILNWVIAYFCWRDVARFAERSGIGGFSAGWYLFGYVAVGIFLGPVALIFPCLVQDKLNGAWNRATNGQAIKAPMLRADWIPVGAGIALWVLIGLVVALSPSS